MTTTPRTSRRLRAVLEEVRAGRDRTGEWPRDVVASTYDEAERRGLITRDVDDEAQPVPPHVVIAITRVGKLALGLTPSGPSGATTPESERSTTRVALRLPPAAARQLDALAQRWRTTRSDAVVRMLDAVSTK